MAARLAALSVAAHEPVTLASFWSRLLSRPLSDDRRTVVIDAAPGFALSFVRSEQQRHPLNQLHLHLTSTSPDDQQATVERALALGASHLDVGQRLEEGHVVLADPEGNEFCVIEPGSRFLAGCGFLGELACDGMQVVGYFWRDALGWPLNWDQDKETSIQSPAGGTKISWGGPPVRAKTARNRYHLDLTPAAGSTQRDEVKRLLSLGAALVGASRHDPDAVELTDPGGNEFCLRREALQ